MNGVLKVPQAGDIVVCTGGHLVCQCVEAPEPGSIMLEEDIGRFKWFQEKPKIGSITSCSVCDKFYGNSEGYFWIAVESDT